MDYDYRIDVPRTTLRQQVGNARALVGRRVGALTDLLPSPSDYSGLKGTWSKDLIAGVTVGMVALPLALGFGVASGMGAAAGLVTAIVAGVVAAGFGGSRLQVSGPTGAMTVVLLPVIARYGPEHVPLLAILGGLIVVVMGVAGLGRVVDMIPHPVVEGFTMGIGVIIALQQIPLIVGTPRAESESTLISSWLTLQHTDWSRAWAPLVITAVVVVVHLVGRRLFPRLPIALIAVVVATLLAVLTGWQAARIGVLPSTLPAPVLPSFSLDAVRELAAPALAVATLAALESLLSARVADRMRPDVPRTLPDRELVGQGLANVASGIFGGLPATGAVARTAVNARTGAHTRLAAVSHAVVLVLVMLLLGPAVALIPMASLGGVLLMTAQRMVNLKVAREICSTTRADRNTLLVTFAATVVFDLITAVLVGVALAAIMSLRHMAAFSVVRRQHLPVPIIGGTVDLTPEQERYRDRIAIYGVDGALFYGDARRFVEEVTAVEDLDVVILRFHQTQVLDASGAEAIKEAARELRSRGMFVVAQGMNLSQLHTASAVRAVKLEHHVETVREALDRAVELIQRVEQGGPGPDQPSAG